MLLRKHILRLKYTYPPAHRQYLTSYPFLPTIRQSRRISPSRGREVHPCGRWWGEADWGELGLGYLYGSTEAKEGNVPRECGLHVVRIIDHLHYTPAHSRPHPLSLVVKVVLVQDNNNVLKVLTTHTRKREYQHQDNSGVGYSCPWLTLLFHTMLGRDYVLCRHEDSST